MGIITDLCCGAEVRIKGGSAWVSVNVSSIMSSGCSVSVALQQQKTKQKTAAAIFKWLPFLGGGWDLVVPSILSGRS